MISVIIPLISIPIDSIDIFQRSAIKVPFVNELNCIVDHINAPQVILTHECQAVGSIFAGAHFNP